MSGDATDDDHGDEGLHPAGDDPDWQESAYLAWREREIAAGRDEEPPEPWEVEGPAVSLSLGDATDSTDDGPVTVTETSGGGLLPLPLSK